MNIKEESFMLSSVSGKKKREKKVKIDILSVKRKKIKNQIFTVEVPTSMFDI